MGKKNRPRIQHEDVYQRVNYLYQAAHECFKRNPQNISLCRYYVYTLRTITRRLCLHLHPDMKRNMCKRCCVLHIPGVTAIVRTRSKRQKHTVVTCLECGTPRRYIYRPAKIPWIEREEAWEDKIIYGQAVTDGNKQNKSQTKTVQGKPRPVDDKSSKTYSDSANITCNQDKEGEQPDLKKIKQAKLKDEKQGCDVADSLFHRKQMNIGDTTSIHLGPSSSDAGKQGVMNSLGKNEFAFDQNSLPLAAKDKSSKENLSESIDSLERVIINQGKASVETSPRPNERIVKAEEIDNVEHLTNNKGEAGVDNSPRPHDKIEESEERPDEYLYKVRFEQGFFPYLR